jgi:hypothetical protein
MNRAFSLRNALKAALLSLPSIAAIANRTSMIAAIEVILAMQKVCRFFVNFRLRRANCNFGFRTSLLRPRGIRVDSRISQFSWSAEHRWHAIDDRFVYRRGVAGRWSAFSGLGSTMPPHGGRAIRSARRNALD